jgi:hypothetical protein
MGVRRAASDGHLCVIAKSRAAHARNVIDDLVGDGHPLQGLAPVWGSIRRCRPIGA